MKKSCKFKHAKKTEKVRKFKALDDRWEWVGGMRDGTGKRRIRQNLLTNSEHALHPCGGGGSKRFAHAAAPFPSQGILESYFRYHFEHQMALRKGRF